MNSNRGLTIIAVAEFAAFAFTMVAVLTSLVSVANAGQKVTAGLAVPSNQQVSMDQIDHERKNISSSPWRTACPSGGTTCCVEATSRCASFRAKLNDAGVSRLTADRIEILQVNLGKHCFGCTAGAGSGCQGAIS